MAAAHGVMVGRMNGDRLFGVISSCGVLFGLSAFFSIGPSQRASSR